MKSIFRVYSVLIVALLAYLVFYPVMANAGTAVLSWSIPATRIDGATMTADEISKYVVYVGSDASNLLQHTDILDGLATTYDLVLVPGQYYLAITTVDTIGQESAYSNIAYKEILPKNPTAPVLQVQ